MRAVAVLDHRPVDRRVAKLVDGFDVGARLDEHLDDLDLRVVRVRRDVHRRVLAPGPRMLTSAPAAISILAHSILPASFIP